MNPLPAKSRRIPRAMLAGTCLLWLAAFTVTHIPLAGLPIELPKDKTLHIIGYFGLAAAAMATMAAYGIRRPRRIVALMILVAGYGALDELTQPLVNRVASLGDWYADLLGAALAMAVIEIILLLKQRRTRPQPPAQ